MADGYNNNQKVIELNLDTASREGFPICFGSPCCRRTHTCPLPYPTCGGALSGFGWRAQPAKRVGGLFGRAKAAAKGVADEAEDLVDDPQVGTRGCWD